MKKKVLSVLVVLLATLLITMTVLAYSYSANIIVTESGSVTYAQLPIIASINNAYLATNGYIRPNALDTRLLRSSTEIPHMIEDARLLFCSAVTADTQPTFTYTLGNSVLVSTMSSDIGFSGGPGQFVIGTSATDTRRYVCGTRDYFDTILGVGGFVTVTDDPALELGSVFRISQEGWVDTDVAANKDLVFKNAAFRTYISANTDITSIITGGATVTASGVASGIHTVITIADGTNLKIFVDGVEEDSAALGGVSVPDNGNNWIINRNDTLSYMIHYKHMVGRTHVIQFQLNAIVSSPTLPDRDGMAHNGTITWGANPAGIAVAVYGLEATGAVPSVVTDEPAPPDIVSETSAEDMFTESLGTNIPLFYPMFKFASDTTGWPIQIFWMTGAIILAMLIGVLSIMFLHSMMIAGIASGVVLVAACTIDGGVISWWVLYVYIIMAVTFVVYQKVVSV